jgi:glycosyltransferase involved in cell wall biosynthesis
VYSDAQAHLCGKPALQIRNLPLERRPARARLPLFIPPMKLDRLTAVRRSRKSPETATTQPHRDDILPATVPLGVLIRFKNSASTLPGVLAALRAQTRQPDLILGIDTGSTDDSPGLLRAAGAQIIPWQEPYHHSRVLNFGLARCPAERVLVLSSHTVLESPDALARLEAALDDPRVACASSPWDADPFYSEAITWNEVRQKGLKIGSFYSNSFGLLRRQLWEEVSFDEDLPTMEDYAWALAQIHRGYICRRVPFDFSYQRQANARDFIFTACAFRLAFRYRLPMRWLGRAASAKEWIRFTATGFRHSLSPEDIAQKKLHSSRLLASLCWPFHRATTDAPVASSAKNASG